MARLIEAEKVYELGHRTPFHIGIADLCDLKELLADVPTVDAVEVVRCKHCKHWHKDVAGCTDFVGRCEFANYMVGATGYCSYGQRKDGDKNA